MALTSARFLLRHPEFASVELEAVEVFVEDANNRTPAAVWGAEQEAAAAWLAAHLLELSPYGRDARLDEDGRTTYQVARERMELETAPGAFARTT